MRFTVVFLSAFLCGTYVAPVFAQEVVLPPSVEKRQAAVPDTVLYSILLHQVATFKDMADDLDRQGRDGSPLRRHISTKFGLTPQELMSLDEVALQYREDVKDTEAQLAESVKLYREQQPFWMPGQKKSYPSEAKYLIDKRDNLVLASRDRFHALIGDDEFLRIDGLVKAHFHAHLDRRFPPTSQSGKSTGLPSAQEVNHEN